MYDRHALRLVPLVSTLFLWPACGEDGETNGKGGDGGHAGQGADAGASSADAAQAGDSGGGGKAGNGNADGGHNAGGRTQDEDAGTGGSGGTEGPGVSGTGGGAGSGGALSGDDGGSSGSETADGGPGNACHDLEYVPYPVQVSAVPEATPEALGGTIVSGTYVLTEITLYESDCELTDEEKEEESFTYRLTATDASSGLLEFADQPRFAQFGPVKYSIKYSVNGTMFTEGEVLCPPDEDSNPYTYPYTATSDKLVFIWSTGSCGTEVLTLVRQ